MLYFSKGVSFMKRKRLVFLSILSIALLLSGCSKKEQILSCSKESVEDGVKVKQVVNSKFSGVEVIDIDMKLVFTLDESMKDNMDLATEALKSTYNETYNKEGITLDVSNSGLDINVSIDMDLTKMSKKDKEELELTDVYGTYSATKEEMENEGYSCK